MSRFWDSSKDCIEFEFVDDDDGAVFEAIGAGVVVAVADAGTVVVVGCDEPDLCALNLDVRTLAAGNPVFISVVPRLGAFGSDGAALLDDVDGLRSWMSPMRFAKRDSGGGFVLVVVEVDFECDLGVSSSSEERSMLKRSPRNMMMTMIILLVVCEVSW